MTGGTTVLVISGSMGAGKTTVLGEASDLLRAADIPHAGIDFDSISIRHVPGEIGDEIAYRNIAAVWANYVMYGVDRLLLATAVPTRETHEAIREATQASEIVVCRLRAPLATMRERVRVREPVRAQAKFVANVARLESQLDAHGVDDFVLDNDGHQSATAVAEEMLAHTGWLPR